MSGLSLEELRVAVAQRRFEEKLEKMRRDEKRQEAELSRLMAQMRETERAFKARFGLVLFEELQVSVCEDLPIEVRMCYRGDVKWANPEHIDEDWVYNWVTSVDAQIAHDEQRDARARQKWEPIMARLERATWDPDWSKKRHELASELNGELDMSLSSELYGRAWEALEAYAQRMEAAQAERERRRQDEEARRFEPFCYYRVFYAVADVGPAGQVVEERHIVSLDPFAGPDEWWVDVRGRRVWLANVTRIHCVEVLGVTDMPAWAPREKTEWGEIRVAPEDAARIGESIGGSKNGKAARGYVPVRS